MPNDLNGLPLHPLIVHATVVLVPMAAALVLVAALVPRFRRWAGPVPLIASIIGLALVPLTTSTGETLEHHVAHSALLEQHVRLADGLLPWMITLTVVAAALYAIHWRSTHGGPAMRALSVAVTVLALAASVDTTVQVVRIGHSGARAAWSGVDMSAGS